jgi:carbon monoxide dehydrogenase subunit G
MTIFESKTTINKPVNTVYAFLADMNNHQQLMPESIQNWSSSTDEARFNIPNMASLALRIENRIPDQEIRIVPFEKTPFAIELKWMFSGSSDSTQVKYTISADLNMMMKMLASGPLQKLADHEVQALKSVLG